MGHSTSSRNTVLMVISLVFVYLVWGSTYLVIHHALHSFPPFMQGAIRFTLAGAVMLTLAHIFKEKPSVTQVRNASLSGLLIVGLGSMMMVYAQQYVSSSITAVAAASLPLWTVLWSWAFGRKPSPVEGVALVLGMLGVVLLNGGSDVKGAPLAMVIFCAAPMVWALGTVLSKRMDMPGLFSGTGFQMLTAGLFGTVLSVANHEVVGHISLHAVLLMLFLTLLSSVGGFSAYNYLIRNTAPSMANSFAYVNPVVALVLGVVLGGEVPSLQSWLATGLTLLAVVLLTLPARVWTVLGRRPALKPYGEAAD